MTDPGDPNPLVRRLTRRVQDAALGPAADEVTLWVADDSPPEPMAAPARRHAPADRPAFRAEAAPRAAGWGLLLTAVVGAVGLGLGGWLLLSGDGSAPLADGGTGRAPSTGAAVLAQPPGLYAEQVLLKEFKSRMAEMRPMLPDPPARELTEVPAPNERPAPPKPADERRPPAVRELAPPPRPAPTPELAPPPRPVSPEPAAVAVTPPPVPSPATTPDGGTATSSLTPTLVAAGLLVCVVVGVLVVRRMDRPPPAERTVTFDPHRTTTAGPAGTLTHTPGLDLVDAALTPVLDRYKLVRHLGEGAYGTVFLGVPADRPGERVAVKFFAYHSARWAHLQAEVKRLTDLGGLAGVVQLHEVAADADPPYFVMRYAEGGSLADKLRVGPLPPAEAVRLARPLAAALAGVHARGLVHCDLKPANVLLDAAGEPLLADFGQSQMVGDEAPALGTLFYMPPEQAEPGRRPPDPRWDVYALGATLHALVCGQPPHAADTVRSALHRTPDLAGKLSAYRAHLLAADPPTAHRGRCPELAGVIDRCLSRDPGKRFADAAGVAAALA